MEKQPEPWWIAEMADLAARGRGRYDIAIPVSVLEDWLANARLLAAPPIPIPTNPDGSTDGPACARRLLDDGTGDP